MIGDTIRPELFRVDYSPSINATALAAGKIGDGLSRAIQTFGDISEDRKKKKEATTEALSKAKAMQTLLGEERGAFLTPAIEALGDEEVPLSQRAAEAKGINDQIAMAIDLFNTDRQFGLAERGIKLQERKFEQDSKKFDFDMLGAESARNRQDQDIARNEQLAAAMASPLLQAVLDKSRGMESSGIRPPVSPEHIARMMDSDADPKQKVDFANAIAALVPQRAKRELVDIPFTIDGKPSTAKGYFDEERGQFVIPPVTNTSDLSNRLPPNLAPYAEIFIDAGTRYGVDPTMLAAISMHETANGTSSAFRNKNNAMGISDSKGPVRMASIPDSIYKMAQLLGSTTSGPYKNANTIPEAGAIYAPKGAGNDPRNLNRHWPAGVAANVSALGGDPRAPFKIQPGAAKTAAKTPTEQAIDQARLDKLKGDIAAQDVAKAEATKAKAAARSTLENTIRRTYELENHPGFKDLFGLTLVPGSIPGTARQDAEAIANQLRGSAFLSAVSQMKGMGALSDAEGRKLEQAAIRLSNQQSEKAAKAALADFRATLQQTLGQMPASPSSPTIQQSATDALRSMIPAK